MRSRIIQVLLGVIVLVVVVGSLTLYTVDAREYGLVTRFGEPVAKRDQPGAYFKWPSPIESVYRVDRRLQVYMTPLIQCATKDEKVIRFQGYLTWRVTDPWQFHVSVSSIEEARRRVGSVLSASLQDMVGRTELAVFFSDQADREALARLEQSVRDVVSASMEPEYGIVATDVGISRLALPDETTQSVYDSMRAERETVAKKLRNAGIKRAAEITTEANRQRDVTLAEARKQAAIIRGTAEATAARTYAETFSQDADFYEFMRTLDTYGKILRENATLVVSSDSDLFRLLYGRKQPGATTQKSGATGSPDER